MAAGGSGGRVQATARSSRGKWVPACLREGLEEGGGAPWPILGLAPQAGRLLPFPIPPLPRLCLAIGVACVWAAREQV